MAYLIGDYAITNDSLGLDWNNYRGSKTLNRLAEEKEEEKKLREVTNSTVPPTIAGKTFNPWIIEPEVKSKTPTGALAETLADPKSVDKTAPDKTETPKEPVDAVDNPGRAIADNRENQGRGVGRSGQLERPKEPDYAAILKDQEAVKARQISFDNEKIPKWNESRAFNMGLINFGLNLLSGNDLASSFQMAGKTFEESYGREKREAWAEDLRSQGYDEHEIQAWIESGDNKLLTSMEDKEAKAMQAQMARYNLAKAKYETDPATMAYKAQKEAFDDDIKIRQLGLQEDARNLGWAQLAETKRQNAARLAFDKAKYEQDLKDKAAKLPKPDFKAGMGSLLGSTLEWDDLVEAGNYQTSATDIAQGKALEVLVPENQRASVQAQWMPEFNKSMQVKNQASELMGRVLSGAALSESKERPTWAKAMVPERGDSPETLAKKRIMFESMKIYNAQAEAGIIDKTRLTATDMNSLAAGRAQFMLDPNQGGAIVGIQYADGSFKAF